MTILVAAFRLALIVFATILGYACLLLGSALTYRNPAALWRWRNYMVRDWARTVTRMIGMRIRVEGNTATAPGLLVANHLSYLDIPLLFTAVDGIFVAKSDLRTWPVLGFLMRSVNTVFIDRNRKRDIPVVNARIEDAIRNNRLIVVFPEGTSSPGREILPLKSPLLEFAASAGLPVSYATIRYATHDSDSPAHESVCWWGDMTFPDHVFNMLRLRHIEADLRFGDAVVSSGDRKELARLLWERMSAQFLPVFLPPVSGTSALPEGPVATVEA